MGGSTWTKSEFNSYAAATNYRSMDRDELFSREMHENLIPKHVKVRESRDSEQNPESRPLIFALDVTGSMGRYAELIAKDELPKLMGELLEVKPIKDPHLMFMAVDDIHFRTATALQVSQFEADIKILEQLRQVHLVGGGGGNHSESYDLAWLFAALKTSIDSYEKRGIKGILFTMGDEPAPYESVSQSRLNSIGLEVEADVTPTEALAMAQARYQVFHLVIEEGSYFMRDPKAVRSSWNELLGQNVIYIKDFRNLTDVVIATLKISGGASVSDVIAESDNKDALTHAFQNLLKD